MLRSMLLACRSPSELTGIPSPALALARLPSLHDLDIQTQARTTPTESKRVRALTVNDSALLPITAECAIMMSHPPIDPVDASAAGWGVGLPG